MKETIAALLEFKKAYHNLRFHWERGSKSLNDTNAIRLYPFHQSFDELDVDAWVRETVEEIRPKTIREERGLSARELRMLQIIIKREQDDISYLSIEEVEHLQKSLSYLEYTKDIKEFYEYLIKAMPDEPNETPEQQAAYDKAWEKFYETDFVISFGDRSVVINNEATVYNGITEMLEELINYCL